jgi:hypothetical protein
MFLNKLMGLGVPAEQARETVGVPKTVAAAGASAGAATATQGHSVVYLTTGAGATGYTLPAYGSNSQTGDEIVVYNSTSTSGVVYPATGENVQGSSSVSIAQYKMCFFKRMDSTHWAYIISA